MKMRHHNNLYSVWRNPEVVKVLLRDRHLSHPEAVNNHPSVLKQVNNDTFTDATAQHCYFKLVRVGRVHCGSKSTSVALLRRRDLLSSGGMLRSLILEVRSNPPVCSR